MIVLVFRKDQGREILIVAIRMMMMTMIQQKETVADTVERDHVLEMTLMIIV